MPISDSAAHELAQLLGRGTAGEMIPELVRQGLQALIEAEAAAPLGADRHQRTAERRGHRNGSRERLLATPAGDIQLRIPRFRTGSFFPSLLEPRRRVDRALWAVVMEAYVFGVFTLTVESPRGTSPRGAPRTVRDTLASYGSHHPLTTAPAPRQWANRSDRCCRIRLRSCQLRPQRLRNCLYFRLSQAAI